MLSISDGEQDDTLYILATLIAAYSNPHMFFDLRDLSLEEVENELDKLKTIMKEMIG